MADPQLSENDQQVIRLLMEHRSLTVGQLVALLGVTATAIRQRLNRLLALGLVDRTRAAEGRGRPSHRYLVTSQGRRSAGNNLADLAFVLWQEVQEIPDERTRRSVVSGVIRRLTQMYGTEVAGNSVAERMRGLARLFADRQLPFVFQEQHGLPVIKVLSCPYPDLADDDRKVCKLEQELLTSVVGEPVQLCECQKDGDHCCSFHTIQQE